jgi:beta-galactosidase
MAHLCGGNHAHPDCAALESPAPARGEPPRSWRAHDPFRYPLDGTWRFRFSDSPLDAPGDAADPDLDDSDWDEIEVPGHWVLDPAGRYNRPSYTNIVYPIPLDPPHVPDANPTGDHRVRFEVPAAWAGVDRVLLRFDGVESYAVVHVNGRPAGTVTGSRLPLELDVTPLLRPGPNLLHVRVFQWSAQTYVEDQDQWWLPGLFRSVSLVGRPRAGLEDVWLRADFEPATGRGALDPEIVAVPDAYPVRLIVDELGIDVTWASAAEVGPLDVGAVTPWSADRPRLYDATVENRAEGVRLRVGFRRSEIRGRSWLINGRRLRLRGVNRHEFDPVRGRCFDEDAARAGLILMKRHHINALRTSHYPPHPRLLDLCDELGFWVVDECDLETHGFELHGWRGNPSDDPVWRANLLDRMARLVERDKNHASVIGWSLGNESGTGANLAAMAAFVHRRDPGRPVHYEGDHEGAYTDVVSRMYEPLLGMADLAAGVGPAGTGRPGQAARLTDRPAILCEYAHAMGNGPGGLADYEEAFETLPGWHGGFVWEWRDHGLATRTADGVPFHGYGGDFGEVLHDDSFVMDGLVTADGRPSPALAEVAAVFAPVVFAPAAGRIGVQNRYHCRDTGHLIFRWVVETGGESVTGGVLPNPGVPADASGELAWPAVPLDPAADTWLTVTAELAGDEPWAPAGHVVGRGRLRLDAAPPVPVPAPTAAPAVTDAAIAVGCVRLHPRTGALLAWGGVPVADAGVTLWRAPTENDSLATFGSYELADVAETRGRGVPGPPSAERWRRAGLDRLVTRTIGVRVDGDVVEVVQRLLPAQGAAGAEVTYRWHAVAGDAVCRISVAPVGVRVDTTWPRIGYHLLLPDGYADAEWFGLGPGEAYPDSLAAARVGRFAAPIDELTFPYAVPQETGHRPGLRDLRLSGPGLPTLTVVALGSALPGFTVARHDAHEWTAARHQHELPRSRGVHLTLDAAQHGLGSRSCGPDVLPAYQLWPRAAEIVVLLRGG